MKASLGLNAKCWGQCDFFATTGIRKAMLRAGSVATPRSSYACLATCVCPLSLGLPVVTPFGRSTIENPIFLTIARHAEKTIETTICECISNFFPFQGL